jgi:hypothetical protein
MTRQAVFVAVCLGVLPAGVRGAEIRGRIADVDLKKNEVRVEGRLRYRGQDLTLTLTPETRVLFGGEAGALTDLETGRVARVSYERDKAGMPVAEVIRVVGRKPRGTGDRAEAEKGGPRVRGVLRRVALTDRELVVIGPGEKGPKTETTIAVPEKAPVLRDGKPIAFDELREEEKVAVEVKTDDGKKVAVTVYVGAEVRKGRDRVEMIRKIRQGLQAADFILGILERMEEAKKGG